MGPQSRAAGRERLVVPKTQRCRDGDSFQMSHRLSLLFLWSGGLEKELDGVLAEYVLLNFFFNGILAGGCALFTNSDCILAVILTKTGQKCRIC